MSDSTVEPEKKRLPCRKGCGMTFAGKSGRWHHEPKCDGSTDAMQGDKPLCRKCGRVFTRSGARTTHQNSCDGILRETKRSISIRSENKPDSLVDSSKTLKVSNSKTRMTPSNKRTKPELSQCSPRRKQNSKQPLPSVTMTIDEPIARMPFDPEATRSRGIYATWSDFDPKGKRA